MHKREIQRLRVAIQEKGMTIVPLAMYLKGGIVKVKIATAKGKAAGDKREAIKERDDLRQIQRAMRHDHA
jgi:SsrA-binding protein